MPQKLARGMPGSNRGTGLFLDGCVKNPKYGSIKQKFDTSCPETAQDFKMHLLLFSFQHRSALQWFSKGRLSNGRVVEETCGIDQCAQRYTHGAACV